ncbi:MAG: gamma-glutamyl-gamma-aminobutyrate hydrolase family protein [Phycisphaerales bacterium]
MPPAPDKPLVAIEPDVYEDRGMTRARVSVSYAQRVAAAGGLPVVLTPNLATIPNIIARCDAFVLTGGDDPRTEPFGAPTDPRVTPVHDARQAFATALIEALRDDAPHTPVLGVCLGMQMMALVAGGTLAQYMPESHAQTHRDHWDHDHAIVPEPDAPIGPGVSHSRHKQCIVETGSMDVVARAPDGVIEAVHDPSRPFYLGVQWHPERTGERALGQDLFDQLVAAIR